MVVKRASVGDDFSCNRDEGGTVQMGVFAAVDFSHRGVDIAGDVGGDVEERSVGAGGAGGVGVGSGASTFQERFGDRQQYRKAGRWGFKDATLKMK